jgi:hypothetical protein
MIAMQFNLAFATLKTSLYLDASSDITSEIFAEDKANPPVVPESTILPPYSMQLKIECISLSDKLLVVMSVYAVLEDNVEIESEIFSRFVNESAVTPNKLYVVVEHKNPV